VFRKIFLIFQYYLATSCAAFCSLSWRTWT